MTNNDKITKYTSTFNPLKEMGRQQLKEERNRGEDSVHKREITKCWMTGIPRTHKFEKTQFKGYGVEKQHQMFCA